MATLAALEGEKGGLRRKMSELELRAGALDEERDRSVHHHPGGNPGGNPTDATRFWWNLYGS